MPMFNIQSSPHFKPALTVSQIMQGVLLALIPGIIVMLWLFGWGVLINIVLCVILALIFEAATLKMRGRPILPYLKDYSAVLTAVLLALALPPLAPFWLLSLGVFFAIIIAKQLYGGLGYNPFNPAMVAYAILIISFPTEMTTYWQSPSILHDSLGTQSLGLLANLQFQLFGTLPDGLSIDSLTAATPLDTVKTLLGSGSSSISEITAQGNTFGWIAGKGIEWVNLAFLVGGVWMIYKRYINWHIPVSLLGTLFFMSLFFGYVVDPDSHATPFFHLFSGATMLGAFFIATDPITASTTIKGRLIFGAGIGFFIYVIRAWGGYPDAIAFAVLIMNMVVPLLDYYTQPRVYGHQKGTDSDKQLEDKV